MINTINKIKGEVGIFAQNINTGESYLYNHKKVFPSASVIKLPILYLLYKKISEGKIDENLILDFSKSDIVDDSPYFTEEIIKKSKANIYDIAHSMITVSDNTSTNLLINLLGFNEINNLLNEMGLNDTVLQRKMCDFETRKRGIDNLTTAYDMFLFFKSIDPLINTNPFDKMFKIITEQKDLEKIPSGFINEKMIIANKPGELPGVRNDCALLIKNDKKVVISILTNNVLNEIETDEIIGTISKNLFEFLS